MDDTMEQYESYDGMNDKPFVAEFVPDEADSELTWFEAVITEFAWLTSQTLWLTKPVCISLKSLVTRGATPEAAACWLVQNLGLTKEV